MDDMFDLPKVKKIDDLNVVPILDMFISVVFFLILSTSFISYTKLVVPPSGVSKITDPLAPPPVSAKMLVTQKGESLAILLKWEGKDPGLNESKWNKSEIEDHKQVTEKTKEILAKFKLNYPKEKTLQLSLSKNISYQVLVSIMDAAREVLPDIVLNSYDEADAL